MSPPAGQDCQMHLRAAEISNDSSILQLLVSRMYLYWLYNSDYSRNIISGIIKHHKKLLHLWRWRCYLFTYEMIVLATCSAAVTAHYEHFHEPLKSAYCVDSTPKQSKMHNSPKCSVLNAQIIYSKHKYLEATTICGADWRDGFCTVVWCSHIQFSPPKFSVWACAN